MAYFKAQTDYTVSLESSANRRAEQPIRTLAEVLVADLALLARWDCIDYPEDEFLARSQLDKKGNLKWGGDEAKAVVGEKVIKQIDADMAEIRLIPVHNQVRASASHTQQLDALALLSGYTSEVLDKEKLSYFGFVFFNQEKFLRYANGFYSSNTLTLNCEPSSARVAPVL